MNYLFSACCYLLLLLPALAQAQAGWQWLNPKPNGYQGKVVRFVDANHGFILQTTGMLLRTADAGVSWQEARQTDAVDLDFAPDHTGYLLSRPGVLWRTTDAGQTWTSVSRAPQSASPSYYPPSLARLYTRVHAISADTVIVLADDGTVRYSSNGGRAWKEAKSGIRPVLSSCFVSGKVGYIGSSAGRIFKTMDGGKSWTKLTEVNYFPSEITMLYFVTPNLGFAHREHSDQLRTTDGGKTWNLIPNRYLEDFIDMHFPTATQGFAVGDAGSIYTTTDAGQTWAAANSGPSLYWGRYWSSVRFTSPTTGYVTGFGEQGHTVRTTDGGKTWVPLSPLTGSIGALNFPGYGSLGYAMSVDGLLKTQDAGDSWQVVARVGGNKLACPDANTLVIAANYGRLHRSTDGGVSWTTTVVNSLYGGPPNLLGLCMVDKQVGFVSGDYNGLDQYFGRTTDGGQTWQNLTSQSNSSLRNLAFLDATRGFASRYGTLYTTADAGRNWTKVAVEPWGQVVAIQFLDATTGYFLDDVGYVYKTTDGGQTWVRRPINKTAHWAAGHPHSLRFLNQNIGCVLDDAGNVFRTTDGGNSWLWERNLGSLAISYTHAGQSILLSGNSGMLVRRSLTANTLPFQASILPVTMQADTIPVFHGLLRTFNCLIDSTYYQYGPVSAPGYAKERFAYPVPWYGGDTIETRIYEKLEPATAYRVRMRFVHNGASFYSSDTVFTTPAAPPKPSAALPEPVLYPNPTSGYVRVTAPGSRPVPAQLQLFNLQGALLLETTGPGLDMTPFRNGMYILTVRVGEQVYRHRLVKQQ